MALVTLQTIFQDAYPAYEQTHLLPAHVRRARHAPSYSAGPQPSGATSRPARTATSRVSGTIRAATGHVRNVRISRRSGGWPSSGPGSWPVTIIM